MKKYTTSRDTSQILWITSMTQWIKVHRVTIRFHAVSISRIEYTRPDFACSDGATVFFSFPIGRHISRLCQSCVVLSPWNSFSSNRRGRKLKQSRFQKTAVNTEHVGTGRSVQQCEHWTEQNALVGTLQITPAPLKEYILCHVCWFCCFTGERKQVKEGHRRKTWLHATDCSAFFVNVISARSGEEARLRICTINTLTSFCIGFQCSHCLKQSRGTRLTVPEKWESVGGKTAAWVTLVTDLTGISPQSIFTEHIFG